VAIRDIRNGKYPKHAINHKKEASQTHG